MDDEFLESNLIMLHWRNFFCYLFTTNINYWWTWLLEVC